MFLQRHVPQPLAVFHPERAIMVLGVCQGYWFNLWLRCDVNFIDNDSLHGKLDKRKTSTIVYIPLDSAHPESWNSLDDWRKKFYTTRLSCEFYMVILLIVFMPNCESRFVFLLLPQNEFKICNTPVKRFSFSRL